MGTGPLLLLVEDDEPIREAIAECLEAEGYRVESAANGADALEWLRAGERPALVLLDLIMPVMSGAAFLDRLRADAALAATPVLLMTAAIAPREKLPNVEGTLSKPFDVDDLLATVRRLTTRG